MTQWRKVKIEGLHKHQGSAGGKQQGPCYGCDPDLSMLSQSESLKQIKQIPI